MNTIMDVILYTPDMADELTALYNAETAHIPVCRPILVDDMNAGLIPDITQDSIDAGGKKLGKLKNRATLVVRNGSKLCGFAQAGIAEDPGDFETTNILGFLLYERGNRKAGQTLLDAVHEHLSVSDTDPVMAFHQDYRLPWYHILHSFCTDRLDHVQALLAKNGYERSNGEVYMVWEDMQPPEPRPINLPITVESEWVDGKSELPGLTLHGMLDGKKIAECRHGNLGDYSRAPEDQKTVFCIWLGVDDEYQGDGVGVHMLHRALRELRERGYRNACISTAVYNHRAYLFYANHGYRTVDWTYGFRRPGATK